MKALLRGVEAAIAIMLLLMAFPFLYSVQFTFKPHETRSLSTIAGSAVQTYHSVLAHYVSTSDLKTLESLLDAVIPYGYGYAFQVAYLEPVRTLFGSQGYRPLGFTADFPYSIDDGSVVVKDEQGIALDTEVVWSWYRIPFQLVNTGDAQTLPYPLGFVLEWQDSNSDGELEPVDEGSFFLYINSTRYEYDVVNITRDVGNETVYVNATVSLGEDESVDGFFYFKVVS